MWLIYVNSLLVQLDNDGVTYFAYADDVENDQDKAEFYGAVWIRELGNSFVDAESTKQMEQTLRAKVKIFFKSENLKKCF